MADVPQNTQPNTNPEGSNIYIRTMGQDVQNLNQGGGNFSPGLGAEQKPVDFGSSPMPAVTPMPSPSVDELQKKIQDMASGPAVSPVAPSTGYTEIAPNINSTPSITPINPEPVSAPSPMPTFVSNPMSEPVPMPSPDTIAFNPMEMPSAPMAETPISNEPVPAMPELSTYIKTKKGLNLKTILIPLIIIVVLLGFYFLVWPKLFKPKDLTSIPSPDVTSPLSTITTPTTLPVVLAFSNSKGDILSSKLPIDITGSPMLYSSVKAEANILGTTNQIKVLQPSVKDQSLTSKEVLFTWLKNVPDAIANNILDEYIMYTYYGEVKQAFGLVFEVQKDKTQEIKDAMLAWEKSKALVKDSANLWLFTPKTSTVKTFKEKDILGATVRYYTYPTDEAALSYTVIDGKLIITTSLESITSALDHLSISPSMTTTDSTLSK